MSNDIHDIRTELIDALQNASDRFRNAFGERYLDHDLTGRGEDFWREYNVMACECESGIDIVRDTPRASGESWSSWLDRVDDIFATMPLSEASKVVLSVRVSAFRCTDVEETIRIATSLVRCVVHAAAIDSLYDKMALQRVMVNAACHAATSHAARRMVRLFPECAEEFKQACDVKAPFAERVLSNPGLPKGDEDIRLEDRLGRALDDEFVERLVEAALQGSREKE
jgi:hypothetical protein